MDLGGFSVMICPNCQTDMPDGVKFCPGCGSAVDAAAAVVDSVMPVEAAIEQIPSVDEKISSEMPNASFDPGAPIAVPKKKDAPQIEETVAAAMPVEAVPEVEPVESVLPEYPQTPATPEAPVVAPVATVPAPVVPAPVAAPVEPVPASVAPVPAPVALTPETVPAPISSEKTDIASDAKADKKSELKAMSTGTAFWLMLLFSIPVIGFIFSIILSCVGKKCKSRKNFARAVLIWNIIGIIITLSLIIVTYFLFKDVFEAAMGGDFNEMADAISDIFGG